MHMDVNFVYLELGTSYATLKLSSFPFLFLPSFLFFLTFVHYSYMLISYLSK